MEAKLLKVHVYPQSKTSLVQATGTDSFSVWVKAVAERGQANEECLRQLGGYLRCSPKRLRIIKGAHTPHKIIAWTLERGQEGE